MKTCYTLSELYLPHVLNDPQSAVDFLLLANRICEQLVRKLEENLNKLTIENDREREFLYKQISNLYKNLENINLKLAKLYTQLEVGISKPKELKKCKEKVC